MFGYKVLRLRCGVTLGRSSTGARRRITVWIQGLTHQRLAHYSVGRDPLACHHSGRTWRSACQSAEHQGRGDVRSRAIRRARSSSTRTHSQEAGTGRPCRSRGESFTSAKPRPCAPAFEQKDSVGPEAAKTPNPHRAFGARTPTSVAGEAGTLRTKASATRPDRGLTASLRY